MLILSQICPLLLPHWRVLPQSHCMRQQHPRPSALCRHMEAQAECSPCSWHHPTATKEQPTLCILLPIPQHFPPGNPICGLRNWLYSFPNTISGSVDGTTLPPGTRKPHLRRSCFSGSRFCEREACSSKSRSAASEAGEEIKIWAVLASPQTSGCNRHCLGPRLHSPPAWPPACAMERGGEGGEDGDGSIRAPSELWGWARSACGVQLPPDTLLRAALHPPNPS